MDANRGEHFLRIIHSGRLSNWRDGSSEDKEVRGQDSKIGL